MQLSHAPRKMKGGNLKFQATSPAILLKKKIEKLETSSGHGLQSLSDDVSYPNKMSQ